MRLEGVARRDAHAVFQETVRYDGSEKEGRAMKKGRLDGTISTLGHKEVEA